ncbi:aquaporin [Daejeonella sp. JGW-45]|uniref:aquaporin n=1 Tax=Daejeonella sp. JGW-45 TaxID=3034148 RepID=UPI0023ED2ACD|nr:aquaporin [Daejeonella sp. JGW-45]
MQKIPCRRIRTFGIAFCGTGAIIINQETGGVITHVGVAITFGLIVTTMIYTLGNISGAHLYPAVSIAFAVARHFPVKELLPDTKLVI